MRLYAHRDPEEARLAIDLFQRITGLSHDEAPVLDLACGTGRHAFELARRGYRVFAADLSPTLLADAQRKTRKFSASLKLIRTDMRHLPFCRNFSAVLQLFTAFGYFRRDEENMAVVGEVRGTLHPGGWYMLDYFNASEVLRSLQPYTSQILSGATVEQERWIAEDRVEKRITVSQNNQVREFRESVRLFTLDDFKRMFPMYGFSLEHVCGDYLGNPYEERSPRCLMFARVS